MVVERFVSVLVIAIGPLSCSMDLNRKRGVTVRATCLLVEPEKRRLTEKSAAEQSQVNIWMVIINHGVCVWNPLQLWLLLHLLVALQLQMVKLDE